MAEWDTAYINDLPDSAFLYVEDGGEKDEGGRTVPRSLRHLPYRNAGGDVDLPHLRNALSRIPQTDLPESVRQRLMTKARGILADATEGRTSSETGWEDRFAGDYDLGRTEVRELPNGGIEFQGYAAVFNRDSQPMPFVETILPGAFSRTIKPGRLIPLLRDHNERGLPLASTESGTLHLSEDSVGLVASGEMIPTSEARDLRELNRAGAANTMSFRFKPVKRTTDGKHPGEEWSDNGRRRTLREVTLFEVSIVTHAHRPAYTGTTAYIRSLAERIEYEPDAAAEAISALAAGNPLTSGEVRLIEAAIAELRVGDPEPVRSVPVSVLRRRMAMRAISLT